MHQTFYIDADEEISSVIDRLRRSMAVDNYFVAPKRAIFLQSIVNLKLLKREAEKIRKHVILVTQEEVVIAMATRSGLDVQKSIDGADEVLDTELEDDQQDIEIEEPVIMSNQVNSKSSRLSNVGSDNFYDKHASMDVHQKKTAPKNSETKNISRKSVANSHEKAATLNHPRSNQGPSMEGASRHHVPSGAVAGNRISTARNGNLKNSSAYADKDEDYGKISFEKGKKMEEMFSQKKQELPVEDRQISNVKTKNFLFIFVIVCMFLFAGVAGYLYIPNADIVIKPNVQTIKIDTDVNVAQAQDSGNSIAVHVINLPVQLTLQYNATGKSSSSGKKAQGTVVIYNEFDNQPQTLVTTTRIQSEGGKIFRLLKTVVVPGLTNVGGETKPGAISVEVVADQPGSDYNIEASNFKIPGFQGGSKYDKFYAKSSVTMSGGTSEGSGSAGVSQGDLDSAKQKTEAALKEKVSAEILAQMSPDEIALPQAEKITPGKSTANAKIGDGVGSFEYTLTATVSALVFSQKDVKDAIEKTPQFTAQPQNATKEIKNIEYVSVEPAFETSTMLLKVHSELEVTPNVDIESFKKDLLGKNESELVELLKKNQSIGNVGVVFWPTFVNRVPQFPERVKIEVEKGQ